MGGLKIEEPLWLTVEICYVMSIKVRMSYVYMASTNLLKTFVQLGDIVSPVNTAQVFFCGLNLSVPQVCCRFLSRSAYNSSHAHLTAPLSPPVILSCKNRGDELTLCDKLTWVTIWIYGPMCCVLWLFPNDVILAWWQIAEQLVAVWWSQVSYSLT